MGLRFWVPLPSPFVYSKRIGGKRHIRLSTRGGHNGLGEYPGLDPVIGFPTTVFGYLIVASVLSVLIPPVWPVVMTIMILWLPVYYLIILPILLLVVVVYRQVKKHDKTPVNVQQGTPDKPPYYKDDHGVFRTYDGRYWDGRHWVTGI